MAEKQLAKKIVLLETVEGIPISELHSGRRKVTSEVLAMLKKSPAGADF